MPLADEELLNDNDKLRDRVVKDYQASLDAFQPLRDEVWPRDYLYWHSQHDEKMFLNASSWFQEHAMTTGTPWEWSMFEPIPYIQVETAVPRIVDAVLGMDPPFTLKGYIEDGEQERETELDEYAQWVQTLLLTQLYEDVRLRRALPDWVRHAEIFGTAILFPTWDARMGPAWKQIKDKKTNRYKFGKVAETQGKIIEEGVRVELDPLWNIFPDPRGRSFNRRHSAAPCRHVTRLLVKPLDEIMAHIKATPGKPWEKDAFNEKKWEDVKGLVTGEDDWQKHWTAKVFRLSSTQGAGYTPPSQPDREQIRILDYWRGGPNPLHAWVAGKDQNAFVVLKEYGDRHPYILNPLPFVALRTQPIPNELFGRSKVEVVSGITHETNVLGNMRIANLIRTITGMTVVNTDALDPNKLVTQVAGVFGVTGEYNLETEIIKRIDAPDVTGGVYQERERLRQMGNLAGGATDPIQGEGGAPTARGTGFQIEQGMARYTLAAQCVGEDVADLARIILDIDRQYMSKDQMVRVVGRNGAETIQAVSPEMLSRRYRLAFDTRPVATSAATATQSLLQLASAFGDQPWLDAPQLFLRLAKRMHIDRPRECVREHMSDAHHENAEFMETGRFHAPNPEDSHPYHIKTHMLMVREAQWLGALAASELQLHIRMHQELESGGMQGSPQGGAEVPEGSTAPTGAAPPPTTQPAMAMNEGSARGTY